MKKILLLLALLPFSLIGQQLSPTELIATPLSNKFAISGIGGGNLYELDQKTGSSSAQVAIDWNLFNHQGETKRKGLDKIVTLSTVFRYNPIITTRILNKDSLLMKKLPFTDNEYLFHFGIRARSLQRTEETAADDDGGNANFLKGGFFDMLYTPYSIRLSDSVTTGFQTLNLNGGYQIGFYNTYSSIGAIGISFALQSNYLMVIDNTDQPNGFEKSARSSVNLPSSMIGGGGKFIFQLNDFSIYFELRNYWPVNSSVRVSELTNALIVSFGELATGTAFKSGKKQTNSNW